MSRRRNHGIGLSALRIQRELGRLAWPFISPICWFLMWGWKGYRIADLSRLRARYRELLGSSPEGVILCPNHLTMIDSALLVWALYHPWLYVFAWRMMPWNLPEAKYMRNPVFRFICYLGKCIPLARGGRRDELRRVLERVDALVEGGGIVLVFPEGRRSRTGRVDVGQQAHGVGRMVRSNPNARVVCVYMRGRTQEQFSGIPPKKDVIDIDLELIHPRSEQTGARGTREISRQILDQLATMEESWLRRNGRELPSGKDDVAPETPVREESAAEVAQDA